MLNSNDKASDRVALVTGGAKGIGHAISSRLAQEGIRVVIGDIDLEAANETAKEIESKGGVVRAVHLDVSSPASIEATFKMLEDDFGRCDVLVNNAGISTLKDVMDYPLDQWQKIMDVNVTGSFLCGQHAARLMAPRQWGRIVMLSSISGFAAGAGRVAYGTSKTALIGLTKQMAIELAKYGITVNGVAPGPIDTPLTRSMYTDEGRAYLNSRIPANRFGTPEEIAHGVAFLVHDLSAYVTGHILPIDGGFLAAGAIKN